LTSSEAIRDHFSVKARPFPGLSTALSDLPPTEPEPYPLRAHAAANAGRSQHPVEVQRIRPEIPEKRIHTRFDKAFLVLIGSELYGDTHAIARNISAGGILVEMGYAPPLGTVVTVHFRHTGDDGHVDEIIARAEVKHHHYLNFTGGNESDSARAVGLRFFEFIDVPTPTTDQLLH
jgi:hypothetical protein